VAEVSIDAEVSVYVSREGVKVAVIPEDSICGLEVEAYRILEGGREPVSPDILRGGLDSCIAPGSPHELTISPPSPGEYLYELTFLTSLGSEAFTVEVILEVK